MSFEEKAKRAAQDFKSVEDQRKKQEEEYAAGLFSPRPEALEFTDFCRKHNIPSTPLTGGYRKSFFGHRKIPIIVARGWFLDVDLWDSQSAPCLYVLDDGTLAEVHISGGTRFEKRIGVGDIPEFYGSLEDILTKRAAKILLEE